MEKFVPILLEIAYIIMGLQLLYTAYCTFKDDSNDVRIGTSLFWGTLGVIFVAGSYIPSLVTGILVVFLAILTLFKQVKIGRLPAFYEEKAEEASQKLGLSIFLPVMTLAIVAFLVAKFFPKLSAVSLGIAALVATIVIILITRAKPNELLAENNRMIQMTSTSSILPQLLAALGAIFTLAGVGTVISNFISSFVPDGNQFFGVVAYVLGMVIFTIIMGNAFAAFTVITAGVGVPFVFALGADPIIASAFAMTAGYCGTLLTPMAANFNALPAALLDMKDKNGVIKVQAPVALIMIVAHIILMYFLAF
ncbi:hypothetical protein BVE84_04100 [Streptococcus azizii]|uniref:Permease n=1 Tax=Streptococcus azizii TaxID=1579424 RepID=A0AB36JT26_9STRE|nr:MULTISPECIES: DUF979 domain-containing protein [Streptococcus]MBF0775527.1 DUF979 domain-containing protein [Streptococcus sp. 19428wD3_AN2]ONK27235.1 hypothetical protein BVE86_05265 [Streptococcus azizii]ONK27690.1 hypothetical protein BVE85_05880 [Streptococcus azizii]ONK29869.1 hypothetical protein BVE84_04100 [Streptococcus azizii]TFU84418.1 DUF979 domain-containing protein [Streptococcus sp. AN2]